MSIGTRGMSSTTGETFDEGGGIDKRSARGRGAGASSMHSESGVVDMLMERIVMGDGVLRIASGCFL